VTFNVTPVNDASGNPIPMLSTQRRGEIIQQLLPSQRPHRRGRRHLEHCQRAPWAAR
jgi:hypothetical protein